MRGGKNRKIAEKDIYYEGMKWYMRMILHGKNVMTDIKKEMVERECSRELRTKEYYEKMEKLMQQWLRTNFMTNHIISEAQKIIPREEDYPPGQRVSRRAPPFAKLFWNITKKHVVFVSPLVSGDDKGMFDYADFGLQKLREKLEQDEQLRNEEKPKSSDKGLPQMISATASSDIPEHILQSYGYVPPAERRQFNQFE